jgi:biopolymer transport protein TolR
MGMSSGHRRRVMSEINVTPLVDVMLVLLIIFMVTAPMLQQGLDVELPETASSGTPTAEDPFIVTIQEDGKIFLGKARVPINDLRRKLTAIFSTRKEKSIYIQADRQTSYGVVAETMAEARAAGIFNISLVTQPKAGP